MRKKICIKKGMSLFEVVVSVALLLTATCAALGAVVYCIVLTSASSHYTLAVSDAQFVLEQIKGLAFASIAAYSPPALSNLPNENITVTAVGASPTLIKVTVNVSWDEFAQSRVYSISTYFSG